MVRLRILEGQSISEAEAQGGNGDGGASSIDMRGKKQLTKEQLKCAEKKTSSEFS